MPRRAYTAQRQTRNPLAMRVSTSQRRGLSQRLWQKCAGPNCATVRCVVCVPSQSDLRSCSNTSKTAVCISRALRQRGLHDLIIARAHVGRTSRMISGAAAFNCFCQSVPTDVVGHTHPHTTRIVRHKPGFRFCSSIRDWFASLKATVQDLLRKKMLTSRCFLLMFSRAFPLVTTHSHSRRQAVHWTRSRRVHVRS